MNWLQQIARRCRELMALAQNAPLAEQLQMWAEELELEGAAGGGMTASTGDQVRSTIGSASATMSR